MKTNKKMKVQDEVNESTPAAPMAQRTLGVMQKVKRSDCQPSPSNPRKTFTKLEELAESFKSQGIRHALMLRARQPEFTLHEPDLTSKEWFVLDRARKEVFRGKENACYLHAGGKRGFEAWFEIVDGERRWRAAEIAGLTELPAVVHGEMEMTDNEVREIQLISFSQREDVSPIEEGESFRELIDSGAYTADSLAARLGKSRSHVFARLKLATLSPKIKAAIAEGKLNSALGELVVRIPGEKLQEKAMKDIIDRGPYDYENDKREPMSVRQAKSMIESEYMLVLDKAPWDLHEKDLVEGVPSCADCPKRTGNCKELFPDFKNPNVCSDPTCFESKRQAKAAKAITQAQEQGLKVLPESQTKGLFPSWQQDRPHFGWNEGSKFMELGAEIPGDKKDRTFKQVLGKDAPTPVVVVSPNGTAHKVFLRADVNEAMKQKGFDLDKPKEAKARRAKVSEELKKLREKIAAEVWPQVRSHLDKKDQLHNTLSLAVRLYDEMCYGSMGDVFKRREIKGGSSKANLAKLSTGELAGILTEAIVTSDDDSSVDFNGEFEEMFAEACKEAGVDLKEKEKAALAAKAETEKPKGKTILHRDPKKENGSGGGGKLKKGK